MLMLILLNYWCVLVFFAFVDGLMDVRPSYLHPSQPQQQERGIAPRKAKANARDPWICEGGIFVATIYNLQRLAAKQRETQT